MTRASEQGSVTVIVTIISVALIFMAGLVVDGGQVLNARRQAANLAESAARAGTQQLDETAARRDGTTRLDQQQATRRAQTYLAGTGTATPIRGITQANP